MPILRVIKKSAMIETPHRLQSIRNQRKLLYRALGNEIARKIARSKERKDTFLEQGPGVVYIARRFEAEKYLDLSGRKVIGRVPHVSFTAHNKDLTAQALESIVKGDDKQALSSLVNTLVVACGYKGEITEVANVGLAEERSARPQILDLFVVERPQKKESPRKAKPLKIRFAGREAATKTITIGKMQYTLFFFQDDANEHMYLLRLVPNNRSVAVQDASGGDVDIKHLVFESLVIVNSRRRLEAELVNKAWIKTSESNSLSSEFKKLADKIDAVGSQLRVDRKLLLLEHVKTPADALKVIVEENAATILGNAATRLEFHPTYAYLRLQYPALRFLPSATNALAQTKENIPYMNKFLTDISKLHWAYAGLRSIGAALVRANGWNGGEDYPKNPKVKHWTAIDGIGRLLDGVVATYIDSRDQNYDVSQKTPEQLIQLIAAMADVVTVLYLAIESKMTGPEKTDATAQLARLHTPDPYLANTPDAKFFGHRLTLRLLADAAVKADVDTGAFEIPDKSNPISLSIKRVKPWTSLTESSESWNLSALFTVYRFKMVNLMEWMGAVGGKDEKPAWAKTYTTQSVINSWKPDFSRNKNVDYTCLIPVRLNVQQQLKLHVHTFVSNIYGAEVRNDKRFDNPSQPQPA